VPGEAAKSLIGTCADFIIFVMMYHFPPVHGSEEDVRVLATSPSQLEGPLAQSVYFAQARLIMLRPVNSGISHEMFVVFAFVFCQPLES
jgi:hypothetical protein